LALLYSIPKLGPDGSVVQAHFGGPTWPLSHLGIDTKQTVYVGLLAFAANFAVVVVATPILRRFGVAEGRDATSRTDYAADEGDRSVQRLAELVDGAQPMPPAHGHLFGRHPDGFGRHGRLPGKEIAQGEKLHSGE
jgi:solute:Na+ symporter, SSS family